MILYLIKGIVCSAVLWGLHYVFLEKERIHVFNRYYLLLAPVFSFFLPFIPLRKSDLVVATDGLEQAAATITDSFLTGRMVRVPTANAGFEIETAAPFILATIYISGLLFLSFRFSRMLMSIFKNIRQHIWYKTPEATIVAIPDYNQTCTFMHYILCDRESYEKGLIPAGILEHELTHIRQKHTRDILFIELISILYWFNPFLILFKRAIRLNHEFLADRQALSGGERVSNYQKLLLDRLAGSGPVFASTFNYSQTKKRLIMMTQTVNRNRILGKGVALAFFTGFLFYVVSDEIAAQTPHNANAGSVEAPPKVEIAAGSSQLPPPPPPLNVSELPVIPPPPPPVEQRPHGKGVTPEELTDYVSSFERHRQLKTDSKGKEYPDYSFSLEEKKRLYGLFAKMTREQQIEQIYVMIQTPIPVKNPPSEELFQSFRIAGVYGVWLDGKKVDNQVLNNYKNTDIAEYSISKLYGAAKKGRSYTHQLDLTTNKAFDAGYEKRMRDRIFVAERVRVKSSE